MKAKKILVIGPSWVGDMVMANSLFQVLKHTYPECHVSVLAPKWCITLLEHMPEVNQTLSLPFGHGVLALKERWQFGLKLKDHNYDLAIILPNSWKSALIPFAAGIPIRRGWRGEMRYGLLNDCRRLDKLQYPSMVSRFNALAYDQNNTLTPAHPAPQLCLTENQKNETRLQFELENKQFIALCPGAEFGMAKRWPPQYYAQLCTLLLEANWSPILMGSAKDAQTTQEILSCLNPDAAQQVRCLAGKTSLTQAIGLLACASAVVSNDSGLMHIAAAFNRPLIAIYGPTSATFTPPLSNQANILQLSLNCQPCHQRQCPLPAGNTHHACMKQILPEQVFSQLITKLTTINSSIPLEPTLQ